MRSCRHMHHVEESRVDVYAHRREISAAICNACIMQPDVVAGKMVAQSQVPLPANTAASLPPTSSLTLTLTLTPVRLTFISSVATCREDPFGYPGGEVFASGEAASFCGVESLPAFSCQFV